MLIIKFLRIIYLVGFFSLSACLFNSDTKKVEQNKNPTGVVLTKKGSIKIQPSFVPEKPKAGKNTIQLLILGTDTSITIDSSLSVILRPWMGSMGHGSKPETIAAEFDGTHFSSQNLVFTMAGKWDLFVYIQQGDFKDTAVIALDVQ